MIKFLCFVISVLSLCGCSSSKKGGLKVAATPVPHAEMLEFIKPDLKKEGVDLVVIVTDDYNMPNRALAEKEIDANFFQHLPFLEEHINQFHYPLMSYAKIEIEPMGIYSKKWTSLQDLPEGAKVAIPNDPTNEARALFLLEKAHLIELDDPSNLQATPLNIKTNPKHLQFLEVDAAMTVRSLQDVDAAAINTNYALEAKFSPEKDALILEGKDSPYVNVLVIHKGEENRKDLELLKQAMTSDKMKAFILEKYKGAVIPAF